MTCVPVPLRKPISARRYVKNSVDTGRYYITAKVERLTKGFDAFTVTADLRTGEYIKRGRIFMDRVDAETWLSKQTVAL